MVMELSVKHQQILGAGRLRRIVVEQSRGVVFLNLRFDEEWQDCAVTVLLTNSALGEVPTAVLWQGVPVEIPPRLLVTGILRLSCVGLQTDETGAVRKRLTTGRMTEGIRIHAAGDQSGFEPGQTVPGLWEQTLAAMGPLQELKTADRTSLVAAVNEALRQGGGTGGTGIRSVAQTAVSEADGGVNELTVTLTDGTETVFQVRNGSRGADGRTPEKGVDYFTEADIAAMVEQVTAQLEGLTVDLQSVMEVSF